MPAPFDLLPFLLRGLRVTIELTAGAAILAVISAFAAGLARLSSDLVLDCAARAYIAVFRGTSALVQLFWVYFSLPVLGIDVNPLTAGIIVLGLNTGAYGAEVVRGAVASVPRAQREAAAALNMTPRQILFRVVLPQAVPTMIPPFGNLLIELLKNTALVSMITLAELTFQAQVLRASTLRTGQIFGLLLLIYFSLAMVLVGITHLVERRLTRWRGGTRV